MNTEVQISVPFSYDRKVLSDQRLIELYRAMLLPRMIEEKMLIYLRQGKISKWFSGIGQEAISVGCTLALNSDEIMFPMHRNLGVFTSREIPLRKLYAQWQGKMEGFTKGRDRSFHFGSLDHSIVGMISHLGPQLALADGVALAYKNKGQKKVALAFSGEGGTSEGDFHEALNVAAVWQLPVIFVVENNGYGLSTPSSQQFKCEHIADKGKGYGMRSIRINGNDILEVYNTLSVVAEEIRKNPEPVLIECNTFRQRGHEEASGTKYVPIEIMDYWIERDPVANYESYLLQNAVLSENDILEIRQEIKSHIKEELSHVDEYTAPTGEFESTDVFQSFATGNHRVDLENAPIKRFIDGISEALDQGMSRHDNLVLMGQDIADYGGVFKITDGMLDKYGADRVRNTPLCESAIVGAALGLSLEGVKALVEMQFADFVTCGFNQIVNNLAKIHYRWGATADVVIRMPTGGGMAAGPFHSQSNEAWFFHVAGLRIAYPATPSDAKGMLLTCLADPNPHLFFEHKALYRSMEGPVPTEYFEIEIGKARTAQQGDDCTIITYGMGVRWAEEITAARSESIEIIDLRWLSPIDWDSIRKSIHRTSRVIVLHEDNLTGGIGAEISAWINEHCFEFLDAPVLRCASMDTPIPFSPILENRFLAKARLTEKLDQLLSY